jgi:CRP-like cAMP-binding protein
VTETPAPPSGQERSRLLRRSFLFSSLADEVLERVAGLVLPRSLGPGETLFWQDDEAEALYGVAGGLIRIWIHGPDGKELTLNLMEPGDFFGEIALLDGLPRTASATAIAASELLVIPRREFLALLEGEPRLARHLIELLCERLRGNTDRIRDAAFLDLGTRLAKTLEALATAHGRDTAEGTVIEAKLSQGALAQLLGVTREAVNKQLKAFEREGLLAQSGGRMVVKNLPALREKGQAKA